MRPFSPLSWFVLIGLSLPACASGPEAPPDALVGRWSGSARIVVDFCAADSVPLALSIQSDGTVAGRVGDAELVDATYARNRGPIGRLFKVKTDSIIQGRLVGPLVAAESIERDSIDIPFDLKFGRLDGGFHTSGTKLGPREEGVVSATFSLAKDE